MRHADQWLNDIHTMPVHISVAKTAERLGIAHVTVHRWQVHLPSVQETGRTTSVVRSYRAFYLPSITSRVRFPPRVKVEHKARYKRPAHPTRHPALAGKNASLAATVPIGAR